MTDLLIITTRLYRIMIAVLACICYLFATNAVADTAQTNSKSRTATKSPDWSGVWIATGSNRTLDPTGRRLRYNEDWLNRIEEYQHKQHLKRDTLTLTCIAGFPRLLSMHYPFAIMVTPEQVVIHYAHREVRHIYTDGREHPPIDEQWPNAWGDSVGHWEGNTLVISTVSIKPDLWIDSTGATLSAQADITERITQVDHYHLKDEVTIDDPTSLDQPWKFTRIYRRTLANDIIDEQCDFGAVKKLKEAK
jgi:hypothetical protein